METSNKGYKLMVFGILIFGIIGNAAFYSILTFKNIGEDNLRLVGFLAISCILIGVGIGLSIARTFKIKGIDNLNQTGGKNEGAR